MKRAHIASILLAAFAILLLLIILAPFMAESGTLRGLDGNIAMIDHRDIWNELDILTGAVYSFGDLICHQMESRTLLLNGNEMPICLRDLSILLGFAFGCLISMFVRDEEIRSKMIWYVALIFVIVGLSEWALEYATGFDSPLARAVTGLLAGVGLALIVQKFVQKMFDDVLRIDRD